MLCYGMVWYGMHGRSATILAMFRNSRAILFPLCSLDEFRRPPCDDVLCYAVLCYLTCSDRPSINPSIHPSNHPSLSLPSPPTRASASANATPCTKAPINQSINQSNQNKANRTTQKKPHPPHLPPTPPHDLARSGDPHFHAPNPAQGSPPPCCDPCPLRPSFAYPPGPLGYCVACSAA